MKNTIKNLMMALLFMVVINGKAADGVDLKVNDQQSLVVEVKKVETGSVLSLINSNGEVLYKDRFLNEKNFSKVIDFKTLPDGKYLLIMDKEFIKSTSVIIKKDDLVNIIHESYSTIFKPCLKIKKDQVSFYLVNPSEKYIEVEIFDKQGETVGNLKSRDSVVKKTFDFSRVNPGDYTFKIYTKAEKFTETITII
ncbi:hypothetical protein [Christiangramia sp. SM2212]|uniref:Secretion system C-terminal sorting domain-containing protein n=1 Tax=Christiangramia sediminicola TaxID=3073267 RepID=A0ABU1EQ33_9FLAO|nr:hypothetical protein [Christiangramia sp. SM2212]MDR5590132.1 hypothetical protein [Christiangramia sp. SM2212]